MATSTGQRASQVRILLKSRSSDIELPQNTGPIVVSTDLKRYQLSTLVNRLLETEKPIPLEFLINGQFLRTTLDEFLTQNGISAETTLNVEYVKALIPPQQITSYEQDESISSIDVLSPHSPAAAWSGQSVAKSINSRILSGSYDNVIRIWNMSNEIVATGQGHTAAVKCAKFLSPTQVVSSGRDSTLRIWKFADAAPGQEGSLTPSLELYGHTGSVDGLAVHTPSSRILSASADHTVGLWSTKKAEAPAAPEALLPVANKRRKLSEPQSSAPRRGPLALLAGHSQQVTDVCFDGRDRTVAYSASYDQKVKTWDLTTSKCVDTRTTNQALTAICHLHEHSLIATGGSLRRIDLVDPRASATEVSVMTLQGHTNWITALARDPSSDYQFISASYDGTCRIWDIRSSKTEAGGGKVSNAVFVIDHFVPTESKQRATQGEEPRVFAVCWDKEVGIVSGGREKKIRIHRASV